VRDIDLRQGCPRATEKKPEMGLMVPSHTFGSDQWLAAIGTSPTIAMFVSGRVWASRINTSLQKLRLKKHKRITETAQKINQLLTGTQKLLPTTILSAWFCQAFPSLGESGVLLWLHPCVSAHLRVSVPRLRQYRYHSASTPNGSPPSGATRLLSERFTPVIR
jgi:hypothetical protein